MSATPAEVESAQKALGCDRWKCQCGETDGCDGVWRCVNHNTAWAERGCSEAVAVADAVLAVAQPRIAALALDGAASDVAAALANEVGGHTSTYSVRRWLMARADEIEAQP